MRHLQQLLSLSIVCLFASFVLASSAAAQDAKIVKIVGNAANATVTHQGGAPVPATEGMAVALNDEIATGAGVDVYVQAYVGAIATVQENSRITVSKLGTNEAELDLKAGQIVSTLDPAKRNTHRYGVRTPRGVAAAKGTVYSVKVNVTGTSVATLSGTVTLDLGGGRTLVLPVGTAAAGNSELAADLKAAIAADPSLAKDIAEAVKSVSATVQNNSTNMTGDATTTLLASVVKAASAAVPEQAATFVQQAVSAVTSSTSATNGSTASLKAVTEAAVTGAPENAAAIAGAAAKGYTETKVTEAVKAAQASGGDVGAAAKAATTSAQSQNQEIANSVAQVLTQTPGFGAAAATATAGAITDAISTGANTGVNNAGVATNTSNVVNSTAAPVTPVSTPTTQSSGDATTVVTPIDPGLNVPVSPN